MSDPSGSPKLGNIHSAGAISQATTMDHLLDALTSSEDKSKIVEQSVARAVEQQKEQPGMSASPGKCVAILGGGSFGSVMARILGASVADEAKVTPEGLPCFAPTVSWWVRRQNLADEINNHRTNTDYLGADVSLPANLRATTSVSEAVSGAQVVVLAVPHEFLDELLPTLRASLAKDVQVVSLLKGLHYDAESHAIKPLTTHVSHMLGGAATSVLAGPNIFFEMAKDECLQRYSNPQAPGC